MGENTPKLVRYLFAPVVYLEINFLLVGLFAHRERPETASLLLDEKFQLLTTRAIFVASTQTLCSV